MFIYAMVFDPWLLSCVLVLACVVQLTLFICSYGVFLFCGPFTLYVMFNK